MKKLVLLSLLLLTVASAMAQRLYIVPVITVEIDGEMTRTAKYFSEDPNSPVESSASYMDYGAEPVMIVGATLTVAEDAYVAGQSDVIALPVNLDTAVTGAGQLQTLLENRNIPASWVANGMTYRQVVRTIAGMFLFFQRMTAVYAEQQGAWIGSIFSAGLTLNGTFQTLSVPFQNAFTATAVSLNAENWFPGDIPVATFGATTTIRNILKTIADQFSGLALQIGPVQF